MKKFFFKWIAALPFVVALLIPLSACSQTRILADFPTGNNIEKVYVSKAMVQMGMQDMAMLGYGAMEGDVEAIEVYSCENDGLAPSVRSQLEEVLARYHAELLVESEDDDETAAIYTLFDEKDKGKSIGMAIIEADDGDLNIVIIHGDIRLSVPM